MLPEFHLFPHSRTSDLLPPPPPQRPPGRASSDNDGNHKSSVVPRRCACTSLVYSMQVAAIRQARV